VENKLKKKIKVLQVFHNIKIDIYEISTDS